MKAYLMDGYIVCTDQPVTGAQAEWELSGTEAELVNAGAAVRYENGAFIITPAKPVIEDATIISNVLTKRAFLSRLTPEEFATIKGAAAQNATVDYWQLFMVSEEIDLMFPDTIAGITMMEQGGLLATGRAAEILS